MILTLQGDAVSGLGLRVSGFPLSHMAGRPEGFIRRRSLTT
jgi:hypothetical protein